MFTLFQWRKKIYMYNFQENIIKRSINLAILILQPADHLMSDLKVWASCKKSITEDRSK